MYVDPKTGRMNPFGLKKFPQFVQPSKNPLYKGEVDFSEVAKKVLPEIRKKLVACGFLVPRQKSIKQCEFSNTRTG